MSEAQLEQADEKPGIPVDNAPADVAVEAQDAEGGDNPSLEADLDPISGMSYEELATAQGWNSEFEGPNARTAQEFVEFGRDVIEPHLKGTRDKLQVALDNAEKKNAQMDRMMKVQEVAHKKQRQRDQQDIENRLSDAVMAGDTNAVNALRKEERELDAPHPEEYQNTQAEQDWQNKNGWYGSPNHKAESRYAAQYVVDLAASDPDITGDQARAAVDTEMATRFPNLYPDRAPAAPKRKAPTVQGGAPRRAGSKPPAKTAKNMPSDAQEMAAQYVRDGVFKHADEYAKVYFESE